MKNFVKYNIRFLFQLIIMIMCIVVPILGGLNDVLSAYFSECNAAVQVLIDLFGVVAQICFLLGTWFFIVRGFNKDIIFNLGNNYNNYPYCWYYICAKLLGVKKCELRRVPIWLQFKLLLNNVFNEYQYGNKDDYECVSKENVAVNIYNKSVDITNINLVFIDTYNVCASQIPDEERCKYTMVFDRNQGKENGNRYYSDSFIKTISNEVHNIKQSDIIVNIFATMNPKHIDAVVNRVFKEGDRNNIKQITVYQQSATGDRSFLEKGKLVYKRR
ncbi:MAG: hypothetical protein R3Y32_05235 [Bacillota bacterium]